MGVSRGGGVLHDNHDTVHDSIRPIRLIVALALKIGGNGAGKCCFTGPHNSGSHTSMNVEFLRGLGSQSGV